MSEKKGQTPLIDVYGENAVDLALDEINKLQLNSNIPFDVEYVKLGASFVAIKCEQILKGEKKHTTLSNLVSESFGEAAIYKYQIIK